jgi:hypothetical protein
MAFGSLRGSRRDADGGVQFLPGGDGAHLAFFRMLPMRVEQEPLDRSGFAKQAENLGQVIDKVSASQAVYAATFSCLVSSKKADPGRSPTPVASKNSRSTSHRFAAS